jgi:hypothetical protein
MRQVDQRGVVFLSLLCIFGSGLGAAYEEEVGGSSPVGSAIYEDRELRTLGFFRCPTS